MEHSGEIPEKKADERTGLYLDKTPREVSAGSLLKVPHGTPGTIPTELLKELPDASQFLMEIIEKFSIKPMRIV